MSDTANSTDAKPGKKGGFFKVTLFALVLLGLGGGGTYAAFAMGLIGSSKAEKKDETPRLVRKGEDDPYPITAGTKAEEAIEIVHGKGGSKYRTAYYNFSEEFTSNLSDGGALIQISLAASTQRDGRVLMWLNEHETALRSRILIELASTGEEQLMTQAGKERLQKRLTQAINEVLEEREGFGGVDNVYFRSLIVQ